MNKFNNPFENFFNQQTPVPESPEKAPDFEAGEYKVRITFKNIKGEEVTKSLDFSVRSLTPMTKDELETKAKGEVGFLGPHNYGMDVYFKNYPDGHPVTINLYKDGEETPIHTFVQKFDGSGKAVK